MHNSYTIGVFAVFSFNVTVSRNEAQVLVQLRPASVGGHIPQWVASITGLLML